MTIKYNTQYITDATLEAWETINSDEGWYCMAVDQDADFLRAQFTEAWGAKVGWSQYDTDAVDWEDLACDLAE